MKKNLLLKCLFFLLLYPLAFAALADPLPEITGTDNVCLGSTETYNIALSGSSCSISWAVNGGTFPDHNNATYVTLDASDTPNEITVEWGTTGAGGTLIAYPSSGCGTYDESNQVRNITFYQKGLFAAGALPSSTVCQGHSVNLQASMNNISETSYTYHWTGGGLSTNGYSVSATPTSNTTYTVTTSDKCNNYSLNVPVTYVAFAAPSVNITSNATAICPTNYVLFTATVANAGSSPSYQWKKNGVNINGEIYATYSTSSLISSDQFTCTVTVVNSPNSCIPNGTTATSTSKSVTVNANLVPTVSIVASNTSICANGYVSLTATFSSNIPSSTYTTWYDNTTMLLQGYISGNNNTVSLQGSQISNNSQIKCVVSNTGCNTSSATSNLITMSVTPTPTVTPTLAVSPSTSYCGTVVTPTWSSLANCSLNTTTGTLTKTSSTIAWDAIAVASNTIADGNFAEVTMTGSYVFLGFRYASTPSGPTNLNYAIQIEGNSVGLMESGTFVGNTYSFYTANIGDKLRICFFNNTIKYYLNKTLLYTSTVVPTGPLFLNVLLDQQGGTASNVVIQSAPFYTYTASVTGGGTSTYNWYINGPGVAYNTGNTYSGYMLPGDSVRCYVTNTTAYCTNAGFSSYVSMNGTSLVPYAGADQTVYLSAPAFTLSGMTPAGGTWSGSTSVTSAGVFTPSSAGVGATALSYTYGGATCTANVSKKIVNVVSLGGSLSNPIPIGSLQNLSTSSCQYYDYRNNNTTSGYTNSMGQTSPEVYYSFSLTYADQVIVSTCGSTLDTYIYILNASGTVIYSNNTSSGFYQCGNTAQAVIQTPSLAAGNYYIVVEGNGSSTGNYDLAVWGYNYYQAYCTGSDRIADVSSSNTSDATALTTVFPNPAADHLTVIAPTTKGTYLIQLFDLHGTLVQQTQAAQQTEQMILDHVPAGLYIVVVKDEDQVLYRDKIQLVK